MPPDIIPLRVIDPPEHFRDTAVGDMWRSDPQGVDYGREIWVIHLPDDPSGGSKWPNLWTTVTGWPDRMWDVTGIAPNITVLPSIFCSPPTGWHGFIRDGAIVNG